MRSDRKAAGKGAKAGETLLDVFLTPIPDMLFCVLPFADIADEVCIAAAIELFKEAVPAISDGSGNAGFNVEVWPILAVRTVSCAIGSEDVMA